MENMGRLVRGVYIFLFLAAPNQLRQRGQNSALSAITRRSASARGLRALLPHRPRVLFICFQFHLFLPIANQLRFLAHFLTDQLYFPHALHSSQPKTDIPTVLRRLLPTSIAYTNSFLSAVLSGPFLTSIAFDYSYLPLPFLEPSQFPIFVLALIVVPSGNSMASLLDPPFPFPSLLVSRIA